MRSFEYRVCQFFLLQLHIISIVQRVAFLHTVFLGINLQNLFQIRVIVSYITKAVFSDLSISINIVTAISYGIRHAMNLMPDLAPENKRCICKICKRNVVNNKVKCSTYAKGFHLNSCDKKHLSVKDNLTKSCAPEAKFIDGSESLNFDKIHNVDLVTNLRLEID